MDAHIDGISHDRLFAAAEAVVTVVMETAARGGGTVSIRGDQRHEALEGLSAQEVSEGISFLIRLGVFEISS